MTPDVVRDALSAGIAAEEAEWEAIATNDQAPDVENTLVALESSGQLLDRAEAVLFTMSESVDGDDWESLEAEFTPLLTAHSDALWLDERIYHRLVELEGSPDSAMRDGETEWLLSEYLRVFRQNGIQLDPEDRATLTHLNRQISALETQFSQTATKALTDAALELSGPELEGLDDDARATLRTNAQTRSREDHLLTFVSPSQQPILARLTDPDARRRVLETSLARANGTGTHDNRATILKLAALRAERAGLLGFANHAEVVTADNTAKTADAIAERLALLSPRAAANAHREADELSSLKAATDAAPFEASDWVFYEERERARRFSIDDDVLRPYLELFNVIEKGVFYAASMLYGLTFVPRPDLHGYAPEVTAWEVRNEDGSTVGLFLGDYYAREGKRGGAWMHNLVEQSHLLGTKPVIMNNLNITKPADGEPTLLTWDEVTTCFHEFGHALHGLFADATYPKLSGTNVPRDFVEFPSQVNEMWAVNPQVLANYARHVKTGEVLPQELVSTLASMGSFGQGFATCEYLGAAVIDQAWHRLASEDVPESVEDVEIFERNALDAYGLLNPLVPPRYKSNYLNHSFGGGYDAQYYSYIWSEVLDADTVEWFTKDAAKNGDGGLNREAGQRFRELLLSRGNTQDPMLSYRDFRGRDAEIEPLFVRRALQ